MAVGTVSTGQWYHLSVVVSSNGLVAPYVNGVAGNAVSVTYPSSSFVPTHAWIGRSDTTSNAFFSGELDGLRLYDYRLSSAQVASLASLAINGYTPPST